MKNTFKLSLLIAVITAFVFTACKKYDEGPMLSLRSKKARIANTWKWEKVLHNNLDFDVPADTCYYKFNEDGSFEKSYTVKETGAWELVGKKSQIKLVFSSYQEIWDILRLKEKELWLQQVNTSNIKIEHHLIPK